MEPETDFSQSETYSDLYATAPLGNDHPYQGAEGQRIGERGKIRSYLEIACKFPRTCPESGKRVRTRV